jgi:organic radical activating enzyme
MIESMDEIIALEPTEILLTGGEPLTAHQIQNTLDTIKYLREKNVESKIILYSALYIPVPQYMEILSLLDGFTFTLHYEATQKDYEALQQLTESLDSLENKPYLRLHIDTRIMNQVNGYSLEVWNRIKPMEWILECPLPEFERLFILKKIKNCE